MAGEAYNYGFCPTDSAMPIYAYCCGECGHAKDVLQKLSDAALTICPVCGAEAFSKQVTAAGFQLKGSGWYATDFRGGNKPAPSDKAEKTDAQPAEGATATTATTPAAATPAAAADKPRPSTSDAA
jgi:putative FmdB family regulatory protein